MDNRPAPMDPTEATRIFAEMLEAANLPRFDSTHHDPDIHELQLRWNHGFAVHIDLTDHEMEPIHPSERAGILGEPPLSEEPIHVTAPGRPGDPREDTSIPGVVVHRTPPLHPDDLTVVNGIPCTTLPRTLIDLAEVMSRDELREAFARAKMLGLLDAEALRASRARVEWRPSLPMLDQVIAEFCE
jgi:hypothetical protein